MSKKGIYYEIPEKYKYSFACDNIKIRPVVSEDKDRYLALASSENLKKFLPKDINLKENVDILAWAGNFCVVNKINANDDSISNKEALRVVELLPYKFTDLEHSRDVIIGCILTAGFSEYGTDKPLTKEDVQDLKSPFNITIGGIIWRMVNPTFADGIEKMGEPDSEISASLSWEIAFSNSDLIIIDKDKSNLEDGKIISDASEIDKLENRLKSFGGSGITDDGKRIARVIRDDLIPLGVGFVSNPAGQVGKIVTANDSAKSKISIKSSKSSTYTCPECGEDMDMEDEMEDEDETECASCKKKSMGKKWKTKADISVKPHISPNGETDKNNENDKNLQKSENSNSQLENNDVNKTKTINKANKIMLKTLANLKDEDLKEVTASEVVKAHKIDLDTEIQKISDEWEAKKGAVDKELKASNDKIAELEKQTKEINEKFTKATEDLEKLAKANADREQEEIFNTRMNYFDSEYDLEDEKIRNIVARKIKNADETKYNEAKEEIELLLAAKKKSGKVFDKETKKWVDPKEVKEEKKESKASVETKEKEEVKTDVVDNAIDNGEKTKTTVAATTTPTETQADKWAKAFGEEGWEVDKRAFRR